MKKLSLICLTLIIIPLAGCNKTITSDVTRFHSLPAANAETIEVVSINPELQNSLEFGQYAEIIGRNLGNVGYSPPKDTSSQFIARIAYSIQATDIIIDNEPRSSVSVGASSGGHRSGVGIGISLPLGQSEPQQEYVHILMMDIIRRSDGHKLYEGRVSSHGKLGLPQMMPHMVDALFQNFPGETGTSNSVKATH